MTELDPHRFPIERATVRDGVEIAYVRAGAGGFPLLLVHGWPETMRIWWRNIEPLAAAGFEVIVPDLRGFGESGLAADGYYDVAAHARDLEALVRDVLGHDRCVTAGGDLGGVALEDMSLRFPGLVDRQILFNTVPPILPDQYTAAGIELAIGPETLQAADYFARHARDADGLAAELSTPELRRRYVSSFYGSRFWASPGSFDRAQISFMTEPFADADRFRASIANYESAVNGDKRSELPRLFEVSDVPTLILYGPDDHVIPRDFTRRMEVAFSERIGPFVVEGSGHFLQWERAEVLNQAIRWFCRDLVG